MKRGFTLLEMAVVLAIIAIIATMSVTGMLAIRNRASWGGATGDLVAALRLTRAEALGRGTSTAFVIDTVNGKYWGYQTTAATTPVAALTAFAPASDPGIFVSGTLPQGITFGPSAGWGATLASPFAGIPTTTGPNYNYCSFCVTSSPVGGGLLRFDPGGYVESSGTLTGVGEDFTLTQTRDGKTRVLAVAIIRQTGMVETFEK